MQLAPYIRKVFYYETDQMGLVHHSNYIRWFEETRLFYMEQVDYGYDKVLQTGVDMLLAGLSCEYISMVRFGQTVKIEEFLTKLTPEALTCRYIVTDSNSGKLRAIGETYHSFYDFRQRKTLRLNEALPEMYQVFAAHLEPDKATYKP